MASFSLGLPSGLPARPPLIPEGLNPALPPPAPVVEPVSAPPAPEALPPAEVALGAALQPAASAASAGGGGVQGWLQNPANRAGLIQASLVLLQPLSAGQSVAGQFGQALGAGAEARDRVITGQEDRDQRAAEMLLQEREVAAREVSANAAMTAAEGRATGGLTAYQRIQLDRSMNNDFIRFVEKQQEVDFELNVDDPAVLEALAQRYLEIHGKAQEVTGTGGGLPAGGTLGDAADTATKSIPIAAIERLRSRQEEPGIKEQFETTFGLPPGGAEKYLITGG